MRAPASSSSPSAFASPGLSRLVTALGLDALLDALAVLAPTECSGCGAADRALCVECRARLAPSPRRFAVGAGPALGAASGLGASSGPVLDVWAALDYDGVPRRVLLACKDGGRTDASRALAGPLRAAVVAALAAQEPDGPVFLACIPSTRAAFRRRGYHPVETVLARARLRALHPLRIARQTEDQAGLSQADRARNRDGSLRALPTASARRWLLVDDILTTGSTLLEARRAIVAAGGTVIGAAVIARTPRRIVSRG